MFASFKISAVLYNETVLYGPLCFTPEKMKLKAIHYAFALNDVNVDDFYIACTYVM